MTPQPWDSPFGGHDPDDHDRLRIARYGPRVQRCEHCDGRGHNIAPAGHRDNLSATEDVAVTCDRCGGSGER